MQPGDYIYGVERNFTNKTLVVNKVKIKSIGAKQLRTETALGGFGLMYRSTHKNNEVYTTPQDAIKAYRDHVHRIITNARMQLTQNQGVLLEIDDLAATYIDREDA